MALKHQIVSVKDYLPPKPYDYEEIQEYIDKAESGIVDKIDVGDDILQALLFDSDGNVRQEIQFNEWGISVIDRSEQEKWMSVLRGRNLDADKGEERNLEKLIVSAYERGLTVIHFGI